MATYTKDNRMEIPDQTPVEMPLGYERPESIESMIARMVRSVSEQAGREGAETFEEADDFDMDDDSEIVSPYQMSQMEEELPTYDRKHTKDITPERDNGESRASEETPEKQEAKPPKKTKKVAPRATEEAEEAVTQ